MFKNVVIGVLASALAAVLLLRAPQEPAAVGTTVPTQPTNAPTSTLATPPIPPPPHANRFDGVLKLVQELHARSELAASAIGFCLIAPDGRVVVEKDAEQSFIPASSLKTVTTATALEVLGPEFRFTTELKATAEIQQGTLDGNLVLVGGGDPMLSLADLQAWATELRKRGLQRVQGQLVVDASLFKGSLYGDFWNWGDIGNGYGSGVSALNVDHNRFKLRFRPGSTEGAPAALVATVPEVTGVTWNNQVTTGPANSGDGVVIHGGEGTHVVHLRGTVPLTPKLFQVTGAVPDPAKHAVYHFQKALQAEGIQVLGQSRPANTSASVSLLRHESPPLLDIVTSIHASSDNHETECVFRMLALKAGKPALEVIREHWQARGLNFAGLRMEDGCGLSRADFIRPLDLARLQYLAAQGAQGATYKNSLLTDGRLRWKGGAMSGVRTLTGYVTTQSGEEFCFALMLNHFTASRTVSEACRLVTDALLGL